MRNALLLTKVPAPDCPTSIKKKRRIHHSSQSFSFCFPFLQPCQILGTSIKINLVNYVGEEEVILSLDSSTWDTTHSVGSIHPIHPTSRDFN
jgi:hypothetical protein